MLYMIKKCWHAMHGKWNINFNVDPIFPAAQMIEMYNGPFGVNP